jgi:hypothetical protein
MQESEAKDASKWVLKSCRGSAPVEENNDTIDGWIAFENMFFMSFLSDSNAPIRDLLDLGSFERASSLQRSSEMKWRERRFIRSFDVKVAAKYRLLYPAFSTFFDPNYPNLLR